MRAYHILTGVVLMAAAPALAHPGMPGHVHAEGSHALVTYGLGFLAAGVFIAAAAYAFLRGNMASRRNRRK